MPNIIYVLTNEAMPDIVKIGITNDSIESRLTQLSSHSGVPLPFECYFAAEVLDADHVEKTLHQLFAEHRLNPKREFFRIDPEKVVLAISLGSFKEITPGGAVVDPEEKEALEKQKSRRPPLRFETIGIKQGDVLVFSRDESITATVVENSKVQLDGEVLSPSAAALKILKKKGYKTTTAAGSAYWMFDGELLDERRRRLEDEQFGKPGSGN